MKWFLLLVLAFSTAGLGQTQVFERGIPKPDAAFATSELRSIDWTQDNKAFVTDDFHVGNKGEVWLVDTIRTWVVTDSNLDAPGVLSDLYSKVTLYGGIADPDFSKEPKAPDCDCEGVMAIKIIDLDRLRSMPLRGDLKISLASPTSASVQGKRIFQVDFSNLQWSVPGGSALQFGLYAISRPASGGGMHIWSTYAEPGDPFHLRIFSSKGRLLSGYRTNGSSLRMRVQVWAHLSTGSASIK